MSSTAYISAGPKSSGVRPDCISGIVDPRRRSVRSLSENFPSGTAKTGSVDTENRIIVGVADVGTWGIAGYKSLLPGEAPRLLR